MLVNDIKSLTAESNFFVVLSRQGTPDRGAEKEVMLGYSESEEGKLKYTVPPIPATDHYFVKPWDGRMSNVRKVEYSASYFDGAISDCIINSGLPRKHQRWNRPTIPHFWSTAHLVRICEQNGWMIRRAGKTIPDMDRFRDPNNLTQEQYDHAIREWHRRIFGVWIWINGVITYITGAHYYYLSAFRLDNGYPQYRDRDRRWYYAWQVCLEDRKCLGMVYLKHRRDGATYRCGCIGLETATRGHAIGANFGIMSKDDESAREAFRTKVVAPFQKMPFYFSPMVKDKTDVEKMLEFRAPPRSASDRFMSDETGLESTIEYKSKGKKGKAGFDSYKLYTLLMDEVGKLEGVSVLDAVRLVTPTMDLDGVLGKILATSTNEEIQGETKDEFEKFFYLSDPAMRSTTSNGATETQMLHYFTPAYDGLNKAWIGPFGESIIHKPTEEQMEYLMSLDEGTVDTFSSEWKKGGAYEYLVRERGNKSDLIGYKRQFPFSPKESFAATNPESDYNIDNITRNKQELESISATGNLLVSDLTVRGNLEWLDDFKSRVKFVQHPEGRFLMNKDYLPGGKHSELLRIVPDSIVRGAPLPNRAHFEKYGICKPSSDSWIVIGTDPQKTAKVDMKKGRRYSSAAAHGFYPYRFEMEKVDWVPQLEDDPNFARDWITHAFIFEYICHPKTPEQHHEDMLKACFYFNAKMLYERQVNEIGAYFKRLGCEKFLITDEKWIKKVSSTKIDKSRENAVTGLPSSEAVIGLYKDRTKAFIDYFCWPNKCPFIATLKQWTEFKVEIIEKLDAQVSSGYALLAANPGYGPIRKEQKKADIAAEKKPPTSGVSSLMTLYA